MRRKDGTEMELGYDHLVVALGSVSRTLPIPGLAEHGIGLKSLADATGLRNRALTCLDIAESLESEQARAEYLSFVFVGAGYAGLEGLAELQDFAEQAIRDYPHCRAQGMRWLLVEAQDRIMGEAPPSLSAFAAKELEARGIEIATGTTLEAIDARGAILSNGVRVKARTVVWTAGVRPSPAVASLGMPLDRTGRIPTDREMRVLGRPGVWAIGDCAAVPDPARRGKAVSANRPARDQTRQAGGPEHCGLFGGTRSQAASLPHQGGGGGAGSEQGDRDHFGLALAGQAGVADRAHLSPVADAGLGAQVEAACRLEHRAAVRPGGFLTGSLGDAAAA